MGDGRLHGPSPAPLKDLLWQSGIGPANSPWGEAHVDGGCLLSLTLGYLLLITDEGDAAVWLGMLGFWFIVLCHCAPALPFFASANTHCSPSLAALPLLVRHPRPAHLGDFLP